MAAATRGDRGPGRFRPGIPDAGNLASPFGADDPAIRPYDCYRLAKELLPVSLAISMLNASAARRRCFGMSCT
jgi:hypothetical protein